MRAAVFVSGSGTNLEALLARQAEGKLDADIVLMISDRQGVPAFDRARKFGLPAFYIDPHGRAKSDYEKEIIQLLHAYEVDLILLAGYMRYIGADLLAAYPQRILNIHPALLPKFPGAHGIRDAFEAGVNETGVTIHYVDEGVDTGPVIAQERLVIDPNWDLDTLESHIHALEYELYWRTVNQVVKEKEGNTSI